MTTRVRHRRRALFVLGVGLCSVLHAATVSRVEQTPSGRPRLVMENQFLRVAVSPAYDGRVASFVDTRTGVDYVWWDPPETAGGGFVTHRLRPGCGGHDGTPMHASFRQDGADAEVTVQGPVSPGLFVRKVYRLCDATSRLDVTMTVRNIDKAATPPFMPTVHNMMSGTDMESTFYVPMPTGLVIQPLDFWRSPGNNFYKSPAGNWYGFVLKRAVQGVVTVFEPDSVERFFHWLGGNAGTWETWLKHRVLEPGEETTVPFSFVATRGVTGYVHADAHVVVGLPRGKHYKSLAVYSVDLAGPAEVQASFRQTDGTHKPVRAKVQLVPGRTVLVALGAPVALDQLETMAVTVVAAKAKADFSVGPITYIDPARNPLPDPQLKDYPKLREFFPYGVTYSIEASWIYPKPRLGIGRLMRLWKGSYTNAIHVCNANLDMMHWFLPLSEANGIRTIPGLHDFYGAGPGPRFGPHFAKTDLLKRAVAPFAEHDGLLAWSIIDEPHTGFLRTFVKMRKAIESVDREHPVTTVTNYFGGNRAFGGFTSMLETDFYPSSRKPNPWPVADWCERADAWLDGRPHWFVAQGYQHALTPAAFRLQTFAALANNAKGLMYFISSYQPRSFGYPKSMHDPWGNPSDLWPDFTRIGRHMVGLGPSLVATRLVRPNPVTIACETFKAGHRSRPGVVCGLRRDVKRGADYVVVYCNDIEKQRTGTVRVPAGKAKRLYDLFAMAPVRTSRDRKHLSFKVRFKPGDGAIYLCAEPRVFEAVRLKALRYRFTHERFVLYRDIEWAMDSGLLSWTYRGLGHKASVAAANEKFSDALDLLADDRRTLDALAAKNKTLVTVRDTLRRIQKQIGALDLGAANAGVKRVYINKRWTYVHGDGQQRAILTRTPVATMCRKLVFDLARRYASLQGAYDTGSYELIAEPVRRLEQSLAAFAKRFRAELAKLRTDPATYGK